MKTPFRRTRGRRVLAWTVVLFALSQVVTGLLLDNCWPLVRFEEARHVLDRYRHLFGTSRSPDVIVLGTSRFQLGIHEDALTGAMRRASGDSSLRAFNASVAAGDFETSEFVLDWLLAENAKPRLLVLEVSPETLNHHSGWINYQVLRLLRWQDFPQSAGQIVRSGNVATLARARLAPLVTYRNHIGHALTASFAAWRSGPGPAPVDSHPESVDWRAQVNIPAALDEGFPKLARKVDGFFARNLRDYRVGGTALDSFRRILDRCRENEIAVLLLSAPVTTFHRELYSSAIQEKYYAFLKQQETSSGIEFIECHASMPDTLFKDGHHANGDGGIYFGEKLGREILGPRWRSGAVAAQLVSRPGETREKSSLP